MSEGRRKEPDQSCGGIEHSVAAAECSRLHGTLSYPDGSPVAGVLVQAFHRHMRREESLGEARTDARGHYSITYTRDQFRRAEKERPDLVIRALDEESQELAASDIVFNAEPVQTIDLMAKPGETLESSTRPRGKRGKPGDRDGD